MFRWRLVPCLAVRGNMMIERYRDQALDDSVYAADRRCGTVPSAEPLPLQERLVPITAVDGWDGYGTHPV